MPLGADRQSDAGAPSPHPPPLPAIRYPHFWPLGILQCPVGLDFQNTNSKITPLRIWRQWLQSIKHQTEGPSEQEVLYNCRETGPGCEEEKLTHSEQDRLGLSRRNREQFLIGIRAVTRLGRFVNPSLFWRNTQNISLFTTSPNRHVKEWNLEFTL